MERWLARWWCWCPPRPPPNPWLGAVCTPRGREAAGDPAVGSGTGISPDGCRVECAPGCRVRSWVPPLPPPPRPPRIPCRSWGGCTVSPQAAPSFAPGCAVPLKPRKHRKGRAGLVMLSTSPGAQPAPSPTGPWAALSAPTASPKWGARGSRSLATQSWGPQRPFPVAVPSLGCPRGIPPTQSGQALIWWVSCSGCARHRGLVAAGLPRVWSQVAPVHVPVSVTARLVCTCSRWERCVPSRGGSCPGMSPPCGPCPRRRQLRGVLAQPRSLPSSSDGFTPANKL